MQIINNPDEQRFEYRSGHHLAVLEYEISPHAITYTHTYVPPEITEKGVGSALAEAAVAYGHELGLKLIPRCPFVAAWLERHPDKLG